MGLRKTLFLSEIYPPLIGGTATMFAGRFGLYPAESIVVLTKVVDDSNAFDRTVTYPLVRSPLLWNGPKRYEWSGMVWDMIKTGRRLIQQHDIQRIECARPFPEGIAAYVLSKLFHLPYSSNVHGDEIEVFKKYPVERVLIKKVLRAAQVNFVNSHATERLVKQLAGDGARTRVVYPGFNPRGLHPADPAQVAALRQKIGGSPILLTVGRIAQVRKGHDQVIAALPEIIQRFPDITYVIIGSTDGAAKERTQTLKSLADKFGVGNHIFWADDVGGIDLSLYYAACDLFIMPNRVGPPGDVEGFGIVFLEAGYFKRPVIGGNSGGVPDAVQNGKTGFLADGTDPHDIAEKSIDILSNPTLAKEMGECGHEFALSLSHERVFEQYQRVLDSL